MEKDHAMKHLTRFASATALAAALATAACNRNPDAAGGNAQAQMALPALPATLPLEAGAATEIAAAPSASDLPDAKPLRLARVADPQQAYGYADAAYSYDEALGDAPPDYGFDYDGADPWAWQGYDDSLMVAEPIDDGYRYYYYRPGADEPYFVRDPFYSYGFADGLLAVVYGADGGIVPYADYGPRLVYASRYYARGRQLWGASRGGKRRPVIAANWLRQRPIIAASRDRWGAGRAHQPAWQRYYESNRPRQASYWRAEQVRRQADARRFDGWRQGGFRTAPPPRAIPVAWEKAKWAQDDRRYRPAADAARDRRDERQTAGGRDARQDRGDDRRDERQQAQRQAERDQRQQAGDRQAQQDQRQAERDGRQQANDRQPQRAERQAQADRTQAQQRAQRQQQADAGRQQAERSQRQAERARRQQADQSQARQAQQAQRQAQQAERRQAAQAEQRQAQQATRAQRQQADRTEARQAQQAERAQRQQAARAEAQQAQRQQAQAARQQQQAERQQAAQAQRQQAQAAERQQQRQQQQVQRQQAQPVERQQMQQQRQERRQERREGRGPN